MIKQAAVTVAVYTGIMAVSFVLWSEVARVVLRIF